MPTDAAAVLPGALIVEEPRDVLVVSGPDRLSWLNAVVTQDVQAIDDAVGAWSLALNKTGKILGELFLVGRGDLVYVAVPEGHGGDLLAHLDRMLIMEDAELEAPDDVLRCWRVLGDASEQVLASARSVGGVRAAGVLGGLSIPWGMVVGEDDGWLEAARGAGARSIDSDTWRALRAHLCIPEYGTDFGPDQNPHEATLERRAVSWTKGCYLGQEVVCMQDMRGKVKRRLVALDVTGSGADGAPAFVEVGDAVARPDGTVVGEVTTVTTPAHARRPGRLLARVKAPAYEAGTALRVLGQGEPLEVTTAGPSTAPFVR